MAVVSGGSTTPDPRRERRPDGERATATASAVTVRLQLLGTLHLEVDGVDTTPHRAKERALLVLLALRRGRPTSTASLLDELWPDGPPETARSALQTYVANLRRRLGPASDRLETIPGGYHLRLDEADVDLLTLEALLARANRGDHAARADLSDLPTATEVAPGLDLPATRAASHALGRALQQVERSVPPERLVPRPDQVAAGMRSLLLSTLLPVPLAVLAAAASIDEEAARLELEVDPDAIRSRRDGIELWQLRREARVHHRASAGTTDDTALLRGLAAVCDTVGQGLLGPDPYPASRMAAACHDLAIRALDDGATEAAGPDGSAADEVAATRRRIVAGLGRWWSLQQRQVPLGALQAVGVLPAAPTRQDVLAVRWVGDALARAGETQAARAYIDAALAASVARGAAPDVVAQMAGARLWAAQQVGDHQHAVAAGRAATQGFTDAGIADAEALAVRAALCSALRAAARPDEAAALAADLRIAAIRHGGHLPRLWAELESAAVCVHVGRHAAARTAALKASELAAGIAPTLAEVAGLLLAEAELFDGRVAAAAEALRPVTTSPSAQLARQAHLLLAEIELAGGDVHAAIDAAEAALATTTEALDPATGLGGAVALLVPLLARLLAAVGANGLATAVRAHIGEESPPWAALTARTLAHLPRSARPEPVGPLLERSRAVLRAWRGLPGSTGLHPPHRGTNPTVGAITGALADVQVALIRSRTTNGSDTDAASEVALGVANECVARGMQTTVVRTTLLYDLEPALPRIEAGLGPAGSTRARLLVVDGAGHLLDQLDELLQRTLPARPRTRVVVTVRDGQLTLTRASVHDLADPQPSDPAVGAVGRELTPLAREVLALLHAAGGSADRRVIATAYPALEADAVWTETCGALVAAALVERRIRAAGERLHVLAAADAGGIDAVARAGATEANLGACTRLCELGPAPGPDAVAALEPLDRDLQHALRHAIATGDRRATTLFAALGRAWWHRGVLRRVSEAVPDLVALLPSATDQDLALCCTWLSALAETDPTIDRTPMLTAAQERLEAADDPLDRARLLNVLLAGEQAAGRVRSALRWAERALEEARRAEIVPQLGTALANTASLRLIAGDLDEARQALDELASLGDEAQNAAGFEAERRAMLDLWAGDLPAARRRCQELLATRTPTPNLLACAHVVLGWLALHDRATPAVLGHVAIAEDGGFAAGDHGRLAELATLRLLAHLDEGDILSAARNLLVLERSAEGRPELAGLVAATSAQLAAARGDADQARRLLETATEIEREQGRVPNAVDRARRARLRDELAAAGT